MPEEEKREGDTSADDGAEASTQNRHRASLSRREMLLAGAASVAAFAAEADAQERRRAGPAAATKTVKGMPFRAFVRHGTQGEIVDLRLRDITPTQVVVRTRGSCGCYTVTTAVLGDAPVSTPNIPNHSGFGLVEAVGAQVRRVRVGDRVLVSGTPWCGHCHQCLSGTPEWCNYLAPNGVPNDPIADMADKTGVIEAAVIGGLSEIIVAYEEYCVPIFSDLPDEQIAMLGDTGAVGIAATDVYDPVQIGQNVVIFGAGPIGLAAVQGAKAKAADAGGQVPGNNRFSMRGADLVIECSGLDRFPPKVEAGPDPSGLLALRQAWEVTAPGGSLVTLAVQNGDIAFPGSLFCLSGKRIYGGQMAGMNVMRDTPRFITAI